MENVTLISANTSELTASEAAFLGGFTGGLFVLLIIFAALVLVGQWKIFEKAGEKGWKSLIPIYGQYVLFRILGIKKWFWIALCVTFIANIMTTSNNIPIDLNASQEVINEQFAAINWSEHIPYIIGIIISIISGIFIDILVAIRTAKAFKKGTAYVLGLIFVPEIVTIVLGFGQAKYNKKAVNA